MKQIPQSNPILFVAFFILSTFALSCCQNDAAFIEQNLEEFINALPEEVAYPANNPYSEEKASLGQLLYWDPIMSGGKDVACVTCHHPKLGYADGLAFSQGVGGAGLGPNRNDGVQVKRNAPTVINTAFNGIDIAGHYDPEEAPMFWDNRVTSLEGQALLPMLSKEEMRGDAIAEEALMDTLVKRLNAIPEYKERFQKAFGTEEINQSRILAAIATFERGIVANNSRFDQYMRSEVDALTDVEVQGMIAFIEVGCADCHSGPMFSDYELHTIGVGENGTAPDDGATGTFDFRTPTLRNLDRTGPYMHNGLHTTLEEVMEFYEEVAEGDSDQLNANLTQDQLDEDMVDLDMDGDQIDQIIAFLDALNDDSFDQSIPEAVPSGLPAGGKIK